MTVHGSVFSDVQFKLSLKHFTLTASKGYWAIVFVLCRYGLFLVLSDFNCFRTSYSSKGRAVILLLSLVGWLLSGVSWRSKKVLKEIIWFEWKFMVSGRG